MSKILFWGWTLWSVLFAGLILLVCLFSSCVNGRYAGPTIRAGYGDAYVTLQHDPTK